MNDFYDKFLMVFLAIAFLLTFAWLLYCLSVIDDLKEQLEKCNATCIESKGIQLKGQAWKIPTEYHLRHSAEL